MITGQLKDTADMRYPRWDFNIMFLRSLHRSSLSNIGEYQKNTYEKILGDLNQRIKDFIENGFANIYGLPRQCNDCC